MALSIGPGPSDRRRSGYLEGRELDALEELLHAALSELESRGVLRPGDPDLERARLKLAAVLLREATDGERDPAALLGAALAALDPDPAQRATL